MEELERAQERLAHIRTVEPIVSALRTISLGTWQRTLVKRESVQRYRERLTAILPLLVPHLPDRPQQEGMKRLPERLSVPARWLPGREREQQEQQAGRVVALVVGSERGLVGRFNTALVERTASYLVKQESADVRVELLVLGTRVENVLQRRGLRPVWSRELSLTALPPYSLAHELTQRWLMRYEQRELDAVDLIYNTYQGVGQFKTRVRRLIPPRLPEMKARGERTPDIWPPPIVETPPMSLYIQVVEQWAGVSLYELLLDSAAAEHSTRYQLMESATQNAERLIAELTSVVKAARRHEITQEMQELAAGAGLIGSRDAKKSGKESS